MAIDQGLIAELFAEAKSERQRIGRSKREAMRSYERFKSRVIAWRPTSEEYERIIKRLSDLLGV